MPILADIGKNCLAANPLTGVLVRSMRLRRGYDTDKDEVGYIRAVFDEHAAFFRKHGLVEGARLLEIGPGGNLGVALLLVDAGADQVDCIDITRWSRLDLRDLYDGLVPDSRAAMASVNYLAPVDIAASGLASETYDGVFSHACFEHFRRPATAVAEIYRLLKPGGRTIHRVDLRDHRDFARPLDFLRYPDWLWAAASSHRGCGGNRWRADDYQKAFVEAGFAEVQVSAGDRISESRVRAQRIHRTFRRKPNEVLATVGIVISARKPPA